MSICSDFPCNPLRLAHCPLDEDLTITEIIENRYEAVLTGPNRKVADNLLLIDGYPYARGGPPVYILDGTGTRVVDPGAGRFLDRRLEGLQHYSLLDADDVVLRALRRGRFRIVHGFADNGNVRSEPHIALVTPAIADLPVAEIRIDACLRDVWRLLISCKDFVFDYRKAALDQDFRLLTELVDFLADPPPDLDPLTTTYERLQALHRFVIFAERWNVDFGRPELIHELAGAADELRSRGRQPSKTSRPDRRRGDCRACGRIVIA